MVRRYDKAALPRLQKTDEGFLRGDAHITRTGVFTYENADGTKRRELRLPDEVFHPDALASFAGKPVTDDHPDRDVTAENARTLSRGHLGDTVRQDGRHVLAPLTVTDAELVEKILDGKVELSCGYDCELETRSGVQDGEPYDAIQRSIRGNHVAVVERGRAGPTVRVRLDAGDARQVDPLPPAPKEPPVKIKINGVEYDPSQTEQIAQAVALVEQRRIDAEKESGEKSKALEVARARADTAEAAKKDSDKARADATDPKHVDALVNARVELVGAGREVLGDDWKSDGLDEGAIKRAVLGKLQPELKLDGKAQAYVDARFDAELDGFRKKSSGLAKLRQHVNPTATQRQRVGDDAPMTVDEVKDAFNEYTESLWQQPLIDKRPAK